ncbi:MAG: RND family transporter [Porphyromonadaceae bacterium]|nr:MAG: RND family transporter [Porphyromonadaceae bacterium]
MFWGKVAGKILRNRMSIVIVIGVITLFMLWQLPKLGIDYGYSGMLPETDSVSIKLLEFNKVFGEEGGLFLFGFQDPDFFTFEKFNSFNKLKSSIREIDGIRNVLSVYEAINLRKNEEKKAFDLYNIFPERLDSQEQLDSLVREFRGLPIYRDLVYSDSTHTYLMVMTMGDNQINTKDRMFIIQKMKVLAIQFGKENNLQIHYSGLPYVRSTISEIVQREFIKFLILAALATTFILLFFFRSARAVFFSLLIVSIGAVWAMGMMSLMGASITVLTGMIPALLIVIGIPNNIFLLNKYHGEYQLHQNKVKALQRVIQKVGAEIFMANTTAAVGFATFMTIDNEMLRTFGLVASVNIMVLCLLCLFLVPVIFSFFPPPLDKHIRHLDNRVVKRITDQLVFLIRFKRNWIYFSVFVIMSVAIFGITKIKSTGYILDDIPKKNQLYQDQKFFENTIKGVLPLEVAIDTRKPNGVYGLSFLKKVESFQEYALKYPELGRSFSLVDGMKVANQAYYNGGEKYYRLPSAQERSFLLPYLSSAIKGNKIVNSFLDSTNQIMRINFRIADVGTNKLVEIQNSLQAKLDTLFPPGQYKTILTGSSLKFTLGTEYLVKHLIKSLVLAILFIAFFMAYMYRSPRMIVVSIFANLLPLLFTAGLMGYCHISIKPSTLLVFSVTYGIAVDTAVHFLSKYRQHLSRRGIDPEVAVINTLKEVGVSVIYTVSVLFIGFGIFVVSEFGGTKAMGFLISITLLIAVISNLLLVPSILLQGIQRDKERKRLKMLKQGV